MVVSETLLLSVAYFGFRPTVKFLFRAQNRILSGSPSLRSWANTYTRHVFRVVLRVQHKVAQHLPSPVKHLLDRVRQFRQQRTIKDSIKHRHKDN